MSLKDAVVESLNEAFPTIITSGSILASAGVLIGFLSSTPAIASIGVCLGRGTLISIFLVMGILPQILLLGDVIIEKTAITLRHTGVLHAHAGAMRVSGHVRGYVSGIVDADFTGSLVGTLNVNLEGGSIQHLESPPPGMEPLLPGSGVEMEKEVAGSA